MKSLKISTFFAYVIFAFTLFGFVWLFATANVKSMSTSDINDKYKTVDVDSIKKDILDLLAERQNVSSMPISVPVDKMGKENPFSGLK